MKRFLKQAICNTIIYSMVFAPSIGLADQQALTGGQKVGNVIQQGLGVTSQILDMSVQNNMQIQQQNQHNMSLMNLVPHPHAENFLGKTCPVMQSRSDRPFIPFCQVADPMSQQMAEQMLVLAQQNLNTFENFETPEAPGAPTGKTCLEDGVEHMKNKLQLRMDELVEHRNKVDDVRRAFKMQADLDKENIRRIEGIISGKDIDENELSTLYNDAFKDKQCRSIFVDDSGFKSAGKKGLNGILGHIEKEKEGSIPGSGKKGDLADYISKNRSTIEQDIRSTASKLQSHLSNVGVANIKSGDKLAGFESDYTSKFKIEKSDVFKDIVGNNFGNFKAKKANLERNVKKLGIGGNIARSLSDPDSNFDADLRDWKNETYTKCMKNQVGNWRKFAKGFKSNNTRLSSRATRGKDLQEYIATVIQDSSISLKERVKRIKQFAANKGYSDFYFFSKKSTGPVNDVNRSSNDIASNGTSSNNQVRSLDNIMDNHLASCNREFSSTRHEGSQYSAAEIETNLNTLRGEYNEVVEKYQDKMGNDLINRMIACNDTPAPTTCDSSQLNFASNSSFCLQNATTCAGNMKKCEAKVQGVITKKVTEKKNIAQQYNQNFKAYTDNNFKLFKLMQDQVKGMAGFYEGFFPEPPKMKAVDLTDLPLDMPIEKYDKALGVNIIGEKDIEKYIKNLNKRYEKIIGAVEKQNEKMIKLGEKRKEDILANVAKDKAFWGQVISSCDGAIDGFVAGSNQAADAADAQMGEQRAEVGAFCSIYTKVSGADNPGAGCQHVKEWSTDSMAVSQFLGGAGQTQVGAFQDYCHGIGSEKDEGINSPKFYFIDTKNDENFKIASNSFDDYCAKYPDEYPPAMTDQASLMKCSLILELKESKYSSTGTGKDEEKKYDRTEYIKEKSKVMNAIADYRKSYAASEGGTDAFKEVDTRWTQMKQNKIVGCPGMDNGMAGMNYKTMFDDVTNQGMNVYRQAAGM